MTTAPGGSQVDTALAANAAQVALLLDIERRALAAVSAPLRQRLNDALRALSVRYVLLFGGLDSPAVDPAQVRALVDGFRADVSDLRGYDPTDSLKPFLEEARVGGVVWANSQLSDPVAPEDITASVRSARVLADIPANVDRAADVALNHLARTPPTDWPSAVRLTAQASQTATGLDRSVAYAVADSMNDAIGQVADARGAQLLWVAEPDACRVCLALSGHLADPATGQWFDEAATFGRPGSAPDVWPPGEPLSAPPRHPNCRCVTQLWLGAVGGGVDLPAALRREARRSIVRGWSLPSESEAARLDAADRLLARGSGLPRSVEDLGRASVRRGRFPNRTPPRPRID